MISIFTILVPLAAQFSTSSMVESAILINADTGHVLYEKKAYERRFPASVTKIATALFILDHKKPNLSRHVVVGQEALKTATKVDKKKNPEKYPAYTLEPDGTTINLMVNERITLNTLLYGLMLGSGNDAANALAIHVGGDMERFLSELNYYLKKLGCKDTNFLNPHGLHNDLHYTTAYDLAVMTRHALQIPEFAEIVKTITYNRERTNKQETSVITQTNRILKPGPFYYQNAYGVKTGYTSNAGFNLVAAAKNQDRNLIAVLLGSKVSEARYKDAIALFEEAFNEQKITQKVYAGGADVFKKECKGAKDLLKATLKNDVSFSYYPSEPLQFETSVKWFDKSLPIYPESCVGFLEIVDKASAKVISRHELFAINTVEATFWTTCIQSTGRVISIVFMHKEGLLVAFVLFGFAYVLAKRSARKKVK